ncbi:MAG: aspartate aminotransferase family protein, partial [Chloroflexi bacterium]|nr:aspartate aminotransferase family protein [Chloroflexota bacterium]
TLRHLVAGLADADSWSTDSHKWLNVPYDSGVVVVRDPDAHQTAMSHGAAYYLPGTGAERDGGTWVGESSRRARGFAVYAALRELGREGLVDLVERCCRLATRIADRLSGTPGLTILNDVVLNQVLVRFTYPGASDVETDAFTREVIAEVQADGTCWLGGTTWHGMAAMRISVSNWRTTDDDIDTSAAAIRRSRDAVAARREATRAGG